MDKRDRLDNKLYDLGQKVDNLQQLNYQSVEFAALQPIIAELELDFNHLSEQLVNSDDKIIFDYTKANYMEVLIEIAHRHGNEVHFSSPYSQYTSGDDFLYDYELKRLNSYREALALYKSNSESKISETWIQQVQVNLSNLYRDTGRIVEALDALESSKDVFGMARINYAVNLYRISFCTTEKGAQKGLLLEALKYYETIIKQYPERKEFDPIPEDIFQSLYLGRETLSNILESEYKDIPVMYDPPMNLDLELGIEFSEYKQWCRNKRLILSIQNLYQGASLCDDIHLPNMGIGYFSHDHSLSYYSWFNTLKQEYNQARYFLYLTQTEQNNYDIHESQENVLLINTLDYPAIGYRTELLKCALKTAYGVFDKIGLLCNAFCGKSMPTYKIGFTNWFTGIENEIRINDNFTALYWVAKDLFRSGSFKTFRLLRNVIEHRYLRIIDNTSISLEDELSVEDKMEYIVSYSDLQEQTYEILKLIRALLFYVVFAFHKCYLETMEMCERENKVFIPLTIDYYDDEWKN